MKNSKYRFVHNLIGGTYIKIFVNMTPLLWLHMYIEHSRLSQYFAHSFTTCQVLNTIASYEYQKNKCIQQWNSFKCLTTKFYFLTYCPNFCEHLLTHAGQPVWETRLLPSGRSFFINNTFSSMSKLLTANMHCWSCKTLVTIYCTHLRVNGIWTKSFCPQKMNNRMLFLIGHF